MHESPLAECIERYKRIDEKLDMVISRLDKVNGRYEKHMDDSINRVAMLESHDSILKDYVSIKAWIRGLTFTMVLVLFSGAVAWGMLKNQVDVNTERWNKIIESGTHQELQ
jgi:hypothetical protein